MCIIAVFAALTFVMTSFLAFPIANGAGYLNFSDVFIMFVAVVVDPISGGLVGLIGASLADLYGGYFQYIAFTAIIKFIEGIICGYMIRIIKVRYLKFIPFIFSGLVMGLLYMIPDIIFYDISIMIFDLPFNIIQGFICGIIGYSLYELIGNPIKKIIKI